MCDECVRWSYWVSVWRMMKSNVTVITRRGEEREEEEMMVRQSRESHSRAGDQNILPCLLPFARAVLDIPARPGSEPLHPTSWRHLWN